MNLFREFIIILIFISSTLLHVSAQYPPSEKEGDWHKITDTNQIRKLGFDPVKLEEFGRYNLSVESGSGVKGCIVIKNSSIIGEWYNNESAKTFINYISSNGKAWAILLFGIIVEESRKGNIPVKINIESKVYDRRWLPEGFPLSDSRKEQITFNQIFKHKSGILPESAGDTRWGEDWDFRYYTVGKEKDYTESGQTGPKMTTRDYARLAYLLLREGKWGNQHWKKPAGIGSEVAVYIKRTN